MITVTPLDEARVLVVGAGDAVNEIVRKLVAHGVSHVTVMDASTAADEKSCRFMKKDPSEFIRLDSEYFKSFHIVISADQPRPFELALSELRWPKDGGGSDPDLPMIVMRSTSNTCKMRCQYRELPVQGGGSATFVSLPMQLLPWTDEKRALVASTIRDDFKPEQNPTFQAYLDAALAVIVFQQSNGSWPGPQDNEQVQSIADHFGNGSRPEIRDFIIRFCEGGLAAAHETTAILGRLVVTDAIKLLTGAGKPINNTNLEEVIKIVAKP